MANETEKPKAPASAQAKPPSNPSGATAARTQTSAVTGNQNPETEKELQQPGDAASPNNEIENTDGRIVNVATVENRSPAPNNTISAADGFPEDADDLGDVPEDDPNEKVKGAEPVESLVVKKFYDENMQLVSAGTTYYYFPKVNQPYPWPLLRPKDSKLEKSLEKEYRDFKRGKMRTLDQRAENDRLAARIVARGR